MAARCSFRPSASPTSTLARRTPAASDSGLSEFVRSRDRALKTLSSSLARTTKSMSCSLARPDRAARSTDARQRPLLICSLSRDRALKTLSSSLARTTKSMSCSLARPDRAARSTDARQRPLLICSLARSRSQDPVFLTRSHDEKRVMLTRSSRQGRAIHRRSRTSRSNKLGLQAKGGHAAGVVLDESSEHPADRRQIQAWTVDRSCQEAAQRVAAGGHPLSLSQRLADQATSP